MHFCVAGASTLSELATQKVMERDVHLDLSYTSEVGTKILTLAGKQFSMMQNIVQRYDHISLSLGPPQVT